MSFDALSGERYLSLVTFKKNGEGVATPVWFAHDGDVLVVVTGGDSWKVKRLRRSSESRVVACNARGKVHGPTLEARTTLVTDPRREREAHRALLAKYGWQMRLLDLSAWIGRRLDRRAYLEIRARGEP